MPETTERNRSQHDAKWAEIAEIVHRARPQNAGTMEVLRLEVDLIRPTSGDVIFPAGDLVVAHWTGGLYGLAKGWLIHNVGFTCVMREPDVSIAPPPSIRHNPVSAQHARGEEV
jgi:hypothetical protein